MTQFTKFTKDASAIGFENGELFFTFRGRVKSVDEIGKYHPELRDVEITEEVLLSAGFSKVS